MLTAENASTPAAPANDAAAIALRIASSGPDMGIEAPKSAPAPVNTGKVSTESQQPDSDGQGTQSKPQVAPVETPKVDGAQAPEAVNGKPVQPVEAKPDAAKSAEADAAAAEAQAEEAAIRARMGLKVAEPETIDTVRRQRAESAKEAKRLAEEIKVLNSVLSESNLKYVKKADGSYGLMADDAKIADNLKTLAPSIMQGLSEDERALVHSDVANKIIQQTLAAVAVKAPKSTATEADVVMPDSEIQGALNSLASERLPDKSEVYHGLQDDAFVGFMQEVFSSPGLEPFRVVANRSKDNMREFLKLVHGAVYRGYAPLLAKKADSAAQKKLKEQELSREPSPSPSGRSPVDAKGQRVVSAADIGKRIAQAT